MDIYKNVYLNYDFEGSYKLVKMGEIYWWKWRGWGIRKGAIDWDISDYRFNLIKNKIVGSSYKVPTSFLFIEGDL